MTMTKTLDDILFCAKELYYAAYDLLICMVLILCNLCVLLLQAISAPFKWVAKKLHRLHLKKQEHLTMPKTTE